MATKQTQLFPPPVREDSNLTKGERQYFQSLQYRCPLREGDTSAAGYAEDLPPAGVTSAAGQSNQNQELLYIKISADANNWTINGAISGPVVLAAQYAFARFKSNGAVWYRVG